MGNTRRWFFGLTACHSFFWAGVMFAKDHPAWIILVQVILAFPCLYFALDTRERRPPPTPKAVPPCHICGAKPGQYCDAGLHS